MTPTNTDNRRLRLRSQKLSPAERIRILRQRVENLRNAQIGYDEERSHQAALNCAENALAEAEADAKAQAAPEPSRAFAPLRAGRPGGKAAR